MDKENARPILDATDRRMPGVKGTRSNFVMEMLKRPTGVPLDA